MRVVYIAHPIAGNITDNLDDIIRIVRKINLTMPDIAPIVPYFADILALSDHIPSERERGISNSIALINKGFFDECWLTGNHISVGMKAEAALFESLNIPVVDYTGHF